MFDASGAIYEAGYKSGVHKGRIIQTAKAIMSAVEELNMSVEKAIQVFTKDLTESEKEEVAERLKSENFLIQSN